MCANLCVLADIESRYFLKAHGRIRGGDGALAIGPLGEGVYRPRRVSHDCPISGRRYLGELGAHTASSSTKLERSTIGCSHAHPGQNVDAACSSSASPVTRWVHSR